MDNQNVVNEEVKATENNAVKSDTKEVAKDSNNKQENVKEEGNKKEKKKRKITLNKILLIVLALVIIMAVAVQVFIYFHKLELQNLIVR